MDELFLTVLSLSVSGGILALALLLLKKLLFPVLPKSWQYYIWALLIVRLIFPFAPEANLMTQVFQNASDVPSQLESTSAETIPPDSTHQTITLNALLDFKSDTYSDESSDFMSEITSEFTTISKNARYYWQIILQHLWIVWLSVALFLFGKRIVTYLYALHGIKRRRQLVTDDAVLSLYRDCCNHQKLKRNPVLYSCSYLPSPMTMGFLRQFLVIPDSLLKGENNLSLVFQHELTHYHRGDVYYKWLMQTTLCLHWFNPLIHLSAQSMDEACELSCDDKVLHHLSQEEKQEYGFTLISCLKPAVSPKKSTVGTFLCRDAREVKNRLKAIRHHRPVSGKTIVLGVILTIFLAVGAGYLGSYTVRPDALSLADIPNHPAGFSFLNTVQSNSSSEDGTSADNMRLVRDTVFSADGIDALSFHFRNSSILLYRTNSNQFRITQYADKSIPNCARVSCYEDDNTLHINNKYIYDLQEEELERGIPTDSPIRIEIYIPASYRGSLSASLDSCSFIAEQTLPLAIVKMEMNYTYSYLSGLRAEDCQIVNTQSSLLVDTMNISGDIQNTEGSTIINQLILNGDCRITSSDGMFHVGIAPGQNYLFENHGEPVQSNFELQSANDMHYAVMGFQPSKTLSIHSDNSSFLCYNSPIDHSLFRHAYFDHPT